MGRLAVIHFSPPELYPPLQNLLGVLAGRAQKDHVLVLTTRAADPGYKPYTGPGGPIQVKRMGSSGNTQDVVQRWWHFGVFYLGSLWCLVKERPGKVLYYESLSAWPAYIYKRYFNSGAEIFIHYHEYSSPEEYASGMVLNRWFHRLENWLYPKAAWVSHTNAKRLELFEKDILPVTTGNPAVMPNYPPASWQGYRPTKKDGPLRLLYLGALSLDTMYTREMGGWVLEQKGAVQWDIYSGNVSPAARAWINSLNSTLVQLHPGIVYSELPETIRPYDVGVILYKGHIPNYVWNAPNKCFEYLVCGLQVWYPQEMLGLHALAAATGAGRLLQLDFRQLASSTGKMREAREREQAELTNFTCEQATAALVAKLEQ